MPRNISKPGLSNQPSESSPVAGQGPIRKSKGKSRLGCFTCKERKVKCDELRPACSQCRPSARKCAYPTGIVPKWQHRVVTFPLLTSSEPDTGIPGDNAHSKAAEDVDPVGVVIPPMLSEPSRSLDIQDVFLLVHFTSTVSSILLGGPSLWAKDATQLAFNNDFLMHAILALSARHLQEHHRAVDDRPEYDYKLLEGDHLQKALKLFGSVVSTNLASSQDAQIATSFLLFFHACADVTSGGDPSQPCEDTTFTFLRGIRSIVLNNPRAAHSGRFKSLVAKPQLVPTVFPSAVPQQGPGVVLRYLLESLPRQSPFTKNRALYVERIESLTVYFSLLEEHSDDAQILDELLVSCLRWQVFCTAEYAAMAQRHDIVALVILAHYYAVVASLLAEVKPEDKWWWLRRKPVHMVRSIGKYVGPDWAAWVEWPRMIAQRCEERI
ncbi:hypothetical protein F5X68DRAFT_212620 [Plectosphaerella plurivora]|uniref:Zn(2)-C6 fungal-type domain-containing protein n=1 Tax=Plectosphaerella plurivora TaxID=936078 RepID=A0A9P8V6Q8_9PEZI|nr:hypothetical protein F5X68DRAFT_212620 [Plectosphaerella plurivora]